jgi:signal transduction histidine kinase
VRIVAVMLLGIVGIELLILVPTTLHFRQQLREEFAGRAEMAAYRIGPEVCRSLCRTPVPQEGLKDLLNRLVDFPAVAYDASGTPVVGEEPCPALHAMALGYLEQTREQAKKGLTMPMTHAGEVSGQCYVLLPLVHGGEVRGLIALTKPAEAIERETRNYVLRILGLVLLICLGTSVIVFAYLKRAVLGPIDRIVELNVAVTNDPESIPEVPSPKEIPDDELGDILRSRSRMLEALGGARAEIEAKNQALGQASSELEQRVIERSRELEIALRRVSVNERLVEVGRLAAGVAHEVNNPVGIIAAAAEDLKRELELTRKQPGHEPETARSLEIIESQVMRVKGIVDSLLRFSRRTPVDPHLFALSDLVRDTIDQLSHRADDAASRVLLAPGSARGPVEARKVHMQQVLTNLIDNALAAGPIGSPVTVELSESDESVTLYVHDKGPGIRESIRKRIFEPFFTTRAAMGGSGMGLAIARELVHADGGTITCHTTEGEGTTFKVVLPKAPESRKDAT